MAAQPHALPAFGISHLLHLGRGGARGAVLVHERAHVAVGADRSAVHALPPALLQPLEHLAQLRAHHQRPLQERLQVVAGDVVSSGARGPGDDELPLSAILLYADRLGLEHTHTLHLGHVPQVFHPALHGVHLNGMHPAVGTHTHTHTHTRKYVLRHSFFSLTGRKKGFVSAPRTAPQSYNSELQSPVPRSVDSETTTLKGNPLPISAPRTAACMQGS